MDIGRCPTPVIAISPDAKSSSPVLEKLPATSCSPERYNSQMERVPANRANPFCKGVSTTWIPSVRAMVAMKVVTKGLDSTSKCNTRGLEDLRLCFKPEAFPLSLIEPALHRLKLVL